MVYLCPDCGRTLPAKFSKCECGWDLEDSDTDVDREGTWGYSFS